MFTFFFYGFYHLFVHLGYEVDGTSALGTYFVFTAFFDHPHIFQTLCRTHYDREEFHKRPYLYTWGLGGSVVAGFLATALGYVHQLIIFAAIFGSWHVIRQHSGFMKAYKRRNQDINPVDNWLDGLTFYTGMFACFFNDYSNVGVPTKIYGTLKVQFPDLPAETGDIVWDLFELMVITFVGRQIWRLVQGQGINLPKLLFMGCALFTHYLVFYSLAVSFWWRRPWRRST